MSSFHQCVPFIGPSLLACDLSNIEGESKKVLAAGADSVKLN